MVMNSSGDTARGAALATPDFDLDIQRSPSRCSCKTVLVFLATLVPSLSPLWGQEACMFAANMVAVLIIEVGQPEVTEPSGLDLWESSRKLMD